MAKVQPKQMAKHLIFFHTGVLRPGLMAMLVIAAIATILTKLTLTHTKLKCSGLRARKWMWTFYILMPFLPTPPHSLRHYSKFINFASRAIRRWSRGNRCAGGIANDWRLVRQYPSSYWLPTRVRHAEWLTPQYSDQRSGGRNLLGTGSEVADLFISPYVRSFDAVLLIIRDHLDLPVSSFHS
jgi:hypothetical protein